MTANTEPTVEQAHQAYYDTAADLATAVANRAHRLPPALAAELTDVLAAFNTARDDLAWVGASRAASR